MINNPHFIVVDDDSTNNLLCNKLIKRVITEANIHTFLIPEEGLEFLKSGSQFTDLESVVLFLDINMPTMSGWEFLEHFQKLDDNVKHKIKVFILSSSVDSRDRRKALTYNIVLDYIVKPLTKDKVQTIYSELFAA
jgi:two-component SAPR family response regulator